HRHAEVAPDDQLHPLQILDVDGLAEAVLDPEIGRLLVGDHAAHGGHLGDVGGDVVTGRQLDDGEGEDGDRPHGEDREESATADVREHDGPGLPPLVQTSPRWGEGRVRGDDAPGASRAYFFQKNVTGREIVGV